MSIEGLRLSYVNVQTKDPVVEDNLLGKIVKTDVIITFKVSPPLGSRKTTSTTTMDNNYNKVNLNAVITREIKEKMEALKQLKEMLETFDDVKDESYKDIDNLINNASALSDEKISNDLDEDKSESTENNDSSSKVEEKSNKRNEKGA